MRTIARRLSEPAQRDRRVRNITATGGSEPYAQKDPAHGATCSRSRTAMELCHAGHRFCRAAHRGRSAQFESVPEFRQIPEVNTTCGTSHSDTVTECVRRTEGDTGRIAKAVA